MRHRCGPPRRSRPGRCRFPAPELRQQHRGRRLHHHEQRHALRPRQRRQPGMYLGRDPERHPREHGDSATAGRCRSAGSTSSAGTPASASRHQATCPPAGCPGRPLAEQLPLPHRVIRVSPATAPTRLPARPPRRIRRPQVPGQHPRRPAVGRDMVHHQHQHEHSPGRRPAGPPALGSPAPGRTASAVIRARVWASSCLVRLRSDRQAPAQLGHGQHPLVRLPPVGGEDGTQDFMTPDHIGQRRPEGPHVEVSRQPHRHRNVVRARWALPAGR